MTHIELTYALIGAALICAARALRYLRKPQPRLTAAALRVAAEGGASDPSCGARTRADARTIAESPQHAAIWAAIVLLAALALATPAHATLITNGTPGTNVPGLLVSSHLGAEYFNLPTAETIQGFEFDVQEFEGATPSSLTYYLYNNSGFFPGSQIATGTNPSISKQFLFDGGNTAVSEVLYDVTLNSPVTLNPGTYWIGAVFTSGGFATWMGTVAWNSGQLDAGAPLGTTNWNLNAVQLYLGVQETPPVSSSTPEPGTMALGAAALSALLWRRYRVRC